MKRLLYLFCFLCLPAMAQVTLSQRQPFFQQPASGGVGNLVVDYYLHMTNGSFGNPVTIGIATNGTTPKVFGEWIRNGTSGLMTLGGQSNSLNSTITVGSTTFPTSFAHQSIKVSGSATVVTLEMDASAATYGTSQHKITMAGFVYLDIVTNAGGGGLFDLFSANGLATGQNATAQILSTATDVRINIESNPGGTTIHSAYTHIDPFKWYYISLQMDTTIGSNRLDVLNVPSFTTLTTIYSTNVSGEAIGTFRLGQNEFGTSASHTNVFENVIVGFGANALAPLGP